MSNYYGRNRVFGHSLRHEGAPHDEQRVRIGWMGVAGYGSALCSCGVLSPELPSGSKRREWHREHKATTTDTSPGDGVREDTL